MNGVFSVTETIGDIVSKFPKASDVFKKYEIDFCCGGERPLSEAIKKQGLDEDKVIKDLEAAYEDASKLKDKGIDWRVAPYSDLIDYVVGTHHAYLNKELPVIGQMTAKILRVHGDRHGEELLKVHKLFNTLKMDLEQHLIKEEEILFPMIKKYEKEGTPDLLEKIKKTITELESEHEGAGDIIKEISHVTNHFTPPSDGCTTYALTYKKIEELQSDLFQHIHLENNILFPRVSGEK